MSIRDELNAEPDNVRRERPKHPAGWEPGVEWDGTVGRITGHTDNRKPDWRSLLEMWDFDPEQYEIVEPVQVRTWDAAIGNGEVRRMWYHRAQLRRKRQGGPDVDDLIRSLRKRKPRPTVTASETSAYLLSLNDWQLGKRGTAATVDRIADAIDRSVIHAKRFRDPIGILAGVGDMVESCDQHYPMQRFEVELDSRAQRKLTRRLIAYAIERHAPLFERLIVPVVGGNHGENNRQDGKSTTTFADNSDLEVFEGVAEAFARAPGYDNVSFVIPHEQLTLTLQPVEGGPILGLAHGHQARRGGATPQQRVKEWVKGQAFGMRPMGDATVILTAHNHHFSIIEDGPRVLIQAPTIDSGSHWWEETSGVPSRPGMLSFRLTAGGRGWDDPKLL